MRKIIYSAIVFQNKQDIFQYVKPFFKNIFCNHITLLYGNQQKSIFNGIDVEVQILKEYIDQNCQTLQMKILNDIVFNFYDQNNNKFKQPHITVSCDNFVKPVYSNKFFEENIPAKITNINSPIIIGKVGCFMSDKTWDFSENYF